MGKYFHSVSAGAIGFFALLAFYFLTMRILSGSWEASWSQFGKLWYFMIPLSLGFGMQVGLYMYIRNKMKDNSSPKVMAVNTTTSTLGMIACCAHHVTDILPIVGLSAFTIFLAEYQIPILLIGIILNLFGIGYLVLKIKPDLLKLSL